MTRLSKQYYASVKTGSRVPYAVERLREHAGRFTEIYKEVKEDSLYEAYVKECEDKYNIFPDIDYSIYSP